MMVDTNWLVVTAYRDTHVSRCLDRVQLESNTCIVLNTKNVGSKVRVAVYTCSRCHHRRYESILKIIWARAKHIKDVNETRICFFLKKKYRSSSHIHKSA